MPERLLEPRRVRRLRDRDQRRVVVQHEVAADHRRSRCRARRGAASLAERSSSAAELIAPADDDDDVGAVLLALAVALDDHPARPSRPSCVGLQPGDVGVGQQRHVRVPQRRLDADDLGVGLGLDEAGEAVAGGAADAGALLRRGLVEHDADAAAGTGAGRRPRGRAASCSMRGSWLTAGYGYGAGGRRLESGRRRARRAPGRAARPSCTRARSRRRTAATPATRRRRAARRRSRARACGTAPRRRPWCCRRRSSAAWG